MHPASLPTRCRVFVCNGREQVRVGEESSPFPSLREHIGENGGRKLRKEQLETGGMAGEGQAGQAVLPVLFLPSVCMEGEKV